MTARNETTGDLVRAERVDPGLLAVEAALRDLLVPAPPRLAPRTLVAVGLADAYASIESPAGPLFVAWNGLGVSGVGLAGEADDFAHEHSARTGRPLNREDGLPERLERAIRARIAGDRRVRIRLDLRGRNEFERAVWMKALEIPPGEVRPYGWIASEIGRPRAVRAVGTALGHNPVPVVVPCHRVVRSDGTLGQYSLGGPDVKRRILSAEGVDLDRLQSYARAGIRLIGSDTTHIFCLPTRHHARRVTPAHLIGLHSQREALAAGFRPCRVCRPASAA
ncbi:MAG TPA: methylated-DNA--[protein]-cysteine S-methyltransferase [Candidatus Limnocylindrales bacterium]